MQLYQSVAMGVIQGLGEFLPISSSAHLILVPDILRWPDFGQTFDVSLHVGTLAAVVVYFKKDIAELATAFLDSIRARSWSVSFNSRLCYYIIAATIPGAIAGKLFEDVIESGVRSSPNLIASLLIGMGGLLMAADSLGKKNLAMESITMKSALAIGFSQALALIPGFSRSGITITSALALGFRNEDSARFSFLLSIPIVLGAGILKGIKIARSGLGDVSAGNFVAGVLTSFAVGYLAIKFLLRFVQTRSYKAFAIYRFIFGAGVILYSLAAGKR